MKIISHRGNLSYPDPDLENRPDRIEEVISKGFDCEIDVRMEKGTFLLGHDFGQYKVEFEWLKNLSEYLWIHCKDHSSMAKFTSEKNELNYFWHENDDFTLTSKNYIWTAQQIKFKNLSRTVLVDVNRKNINSINQYFGVCTDYPAEENVRNSL
tara:strand:+ start:574 stop:1035 length:462 start_codon:yes stop_codon:yes gene_type:complete